MRWASDRDEDDAPARFTVGDAAKVLKVSTEMVRKYVRKGQLDCIFTPRGQRLFREAEVDRFAAERQYLALAPPAPRSRRRDGTSQLRLRLFKAARGRKAG